MKKQKIAAMVVALALVGLPVLFNASVASAASVTGSATGSNSGSDDGSSEDAGQYSQDNVVLYSAENSGDDNGETEDNQGSQNHGVIPPVVIRPHERGDDYSSEDDKSGGTLPPLPGVRPTAGPSSAPKAGSSTDSTLSGASRSRGAFVVAPLMPNGTGTGQLSTKQKGQVSAINPQSSPAIEIAGVRTSAKTPADIFVESATLGISAMAVGALAFGGVAGVRAIRTRRNPLEDYFYESDN